VEIHSVIVKLSCCTCTRTQARFGGLLIRTLTAEIVGEGGGGLDAAQVTPVIKVLTNMAAHAEETAKELMNCENYICIYKWLARVECFRVFLCV
jgi:hypothetical protein